MRLWYEVAYEAFSTELEKIRQRLAIIDVGVLRSDSRERAVAGEMRAFVYVWLAAALEKNTKELLRSLLSEMNNRSIPIGTLRPGLLGLILDADLDSVATLSDHEKLWARKCSMFHTAVALRAASFDQAVLPLDGRTLRPHHFGVIWQVFGFRGEPTPGPLHRFALTDLAEGRNDVAHGDEDPTHFGRGKTTTDLQKLVERVEEVFLHLISTSDAYLENQEYLRVP